MQKASKLKSALKEFSKEIIGIFVWKEHTLLITKHNPFENTIDAVELSLLGGLYEHNNLPAEGGTIHLFPGERTLFDMKEDKNLMSEFLLTIQ